jgi:hypothetical protein
VRVREAAWRARRQRRRVRLAADEGERRAQIIGEGLGLQIVEDAEVVRRERPLELAPHLGARLRHLDERAVLERGRLLDLERELQRLQRLVLAPAKLTPEHRRMERRDEDVQSIDRDARGDEIATEALDDVGRERRARRTVHEPIEERVGVHQAGALSFFTIAMRSSTLIAPSSPLSRERTPTESISASFGPTTHKYG